MLFPRTLCGLLCGDEEKLKIIERDEKVALVRKETRKIMAEISLFHYLYKNQQRKGAALNEGKCPSDLSWWMDGQGERTLYPCMECVRIENLMTQNDGVEAEVMIEW